MLDEIDFSAYLSGSLRPARKEVFPQPPFTDPHMAKRMSNKARIEQKAAEAAASDEAKVAKKKVAKKKVSKKAAAAAAPLKVVWKVFNSNYKEVGCFPYPEKKKAYKMAEDLEKKKKGEHFVNAVKV